MAAVMTTVATSLGSAVAVGDLRILADGLNVIMTVIPAAAIVVVLVLFRRERDVPAASACS